jgi:hypothetical protein
VRFHLFTLLLYAWPALSQVGGFAGRDPRYQIQPTDVLEIHYRTHPNSIKPSQCSQTALSRSK